MISYTWATCSKVIQSEVNTLTTELPRLLGKQQLLGLYLHGSLALGGFNPTRSDINMLAVTRHGMKVETKRTIVDLLMRVSKMPCPIALHFLVAQDIVSFPHLLSHSLPYDFYYSEAQRERLQQDLRNGAWEYWNEVRNHDATLTMAFFQHLICLEPFATELPVVSKQAYRAALIEATRVAQKNPLHNPLAFVLNVCRDAAYLHDGSVLSKEAGGVWGLAHLPIQQHPLIEQMLTLYRGERGGRPVGRAAFGTFVDYVQATMLT